MSSKVNEALFDLIKSMTKSEKRYFKLMSSRHKIGEENNYVLLFDYLDREDNYCENRLHDHFSGQPFLNRFSITKKRLYDHILTALDSFHVSGSVEAQLYKMLHSADILFEKSLYDQSRRTLRSAEKLAIKHEKNEICLLISAKQRRLYETSGYLSLTSDCIDEIKEKEDKYAFSLSTHRTIWSIKSKLFAQLSRKGVSRSNEESKEYYQICSDLLESFDLTDASDEVCYLYNHTLSAYHYAVGDLKTSLDYLTSNLKLFKNQAEHLKTEPNKQVSAYTNAIYIADKLGSRKMSQTYLTELKKLANGIDSNEDLAIKLFSSITSIEFSMCLKRGDFVAARKIALDVENRLDEYGDKIVPIRRAFLEFKMAVVYMGLGEFNIALKWVNQILNNGSLDKTEDIIGFTQLLDLLIHIELNHDKLLPYSLKSTQRFFKTRNRLYSFEKVFLQFISKLIKSDDHFEIEELWEELYNELATITDDTFESVALDYFDFQSWAESKLKHKSFDRVIRDKYNQTLKVAS